MSIPASHAMTQWADDARAQENAQWRAQDEARRKAERDPRQDALQAARSLQAARPTASATPRPTGRQRPAQRARRPDPAPSPPATIDRSAEFPVWLTPAEAQLVERALENYSERTP